MSYPPPFSLLYFIFYGNCLVIFQSVVLDCRGSGGGNCGVCGGGCRGAGSGKWW